jgi:hypothetical protein
MQSYAYLQAGLLYNKGKKYQDFGEREERLKKNVLGVRIWKRQETHHRQEKRRLTPKPL